MPFATDNHWPSGLIRIFETFGQKNQPLEDRYYGPYTKLLSYCFGESFNFVVAPQRPPGEEARKDVIDSIVFLSVFDAVHRPVLIAEAKNDGWANKASLRLRADQQLRSRYILNDCPLPRLWGLSLLGTSTRVYCGDVATGTLMPPRQVWPHDDSIVAPDFLAGGWDLDVLSQQGFNKMKGTVADVTAAAVAL